MMSVMLKVLLIQIMSTVNGSWEVDLKVKLCTICSHIKLEILGNSMEQIKFPSKFYQYILAS